MRRCPPRSPYASSAAPPRCSTTPAWRLLTDPTFDPPGEHAGLPHRFDGAYLTLSADAAAQAAEVLGVRAVVPVHVEGWAHFTPGADELRAAFAAAGIAERLVVLVPGASVSL